MAKKTKAFHRNPAPAAPRLPSYVEQLTALSTGGYSIRLKLDKLSQPPRVYHARRVR